MYKNVNDHSKMTATPHKYPQKRFSKKECRWCGSLFEPQAPSHLYCSQQCADNALDNNRLTKEYGITLSQYHELYDRQNGKCAICGSDGFALVKGQRLLIVVDHCHKTGAVRGLLCHNCNRALGLFKDSVDNLKNAIQYLEGATTIPDGSRTKWSEAHDTRKCDDIV